MSYAMQVFPEDLSTQFPDLDAAGLLDKAVEIYLSEPSASNYETLGQYLLTFTHRYTRSNLEKDRFPWKDYHKDIAQDSMLEVLQDLSKWKPSDPFHKWVITVINNNIRDSYDHQNYEQESLVPLNLPKHDRPSDVLSKTLPEKLKIVLASLSLEDQQLFRLMWEGRSLKEASEQLHIQLSATKMRWNRLLPKIRQFREVVHTIDGERVLEMKRRKDGTYQCNIGGKTIIAEPDYLVIEQIPLP